MMTQHGEYETEKSRHPSKILKVPHRWKDADVRNLLDLFEAVDHPQYRTYKSSRDIAEAFGAEFVPIGFTDTEFPPFQRLIKNTIIKNRRSLVDAQIIPNEVNLKRSSHLPHLERKAISHLIKMRNRADLGIGQVFLKKNTKTQKCERCAKDLFPRVYCVSVLEKHSQNKVWCLGCFRCADCNEFPVDFIYFWHQDSAYCLRHYGEKFRPRCGHCDELIFQDEYTKAMRKNFHLEHFLCTNCHICLTDSKFVVKNNECLCLRCYDDKYAQECFKCSKKIKCKDHGLSFKDHFWHDECFRCESCNHRLNGMPFAMREDGVYCAKCYEQKIALRCHQCNEIFPAGTKTFEFRGKRWHEKCFVCVKCRTFIGTENFIPMEDDAPMCIKCHTRTMLPKCVKCHQSITTGGVSYRGEAWHSHCFVCGQCKEELAGRKFTIRDQLPYCAKCYGESFAKRCGFCNKPISGFHGDQFVTFSDRHYHSSCFNCYKCSSNLIKSGFVNFDDKFACPNCAQQEKRQRRRIQTKR